MISAALKYALAVVVILLPFWFFKGRTHVTIDSSDSSMQTSGYSEGTYGLDSTPLRSKDLKQGDVIAYRPPKEPDHWRVGRVLAVEGARVEVGAKGAKVNGTVVRENIDLGNWSFPEIKIPRGCVFVLADMPRLGLDSMQLGPIPFSHVAGRLKEPR
jgi:signal peptidase I